MSLEILTLDGNPIILEKNKEGKYEITKEELNELINKAYVAGQRSINNLKLSNPPTVTYPDLPFWYDNKIWCGQVGEPITVLSSSTKKSGCDLNINTNYTQR